MGVLHVSAAPLSDSPLPPPNQSAIALLGFFLVCYSIATIGAIATVHSIPTWYASLIKPAFNPPNWVFAPVWILLYGFMAIAAWLVWRTPYIGPNADARSNGLIYFTFQLVLNALWTIVFFHFHRLFFALIIILGLWYAIYSAVRCFWKVDRFAAGLMFLYLAWVSFATLLNFAILRLNR
jgi:translocator protein